MISNQVKLKKLPVNKKDEREDFPPLFDIIEDLGLIQGEYSKHWDIYEDYYNLLFLDFEERIYMLDGKIGEVISLRNRFLSGTKMTKEEKFSALDLLTTEQKEFYEKKKDLDNAKMAFSFLNTIPSMLEDNRKRRLAEKERRK